MPEIRLVPVKPPQITLTPVGDGAARRRGQSQEPNTFSDVIASGAAGFARGAADLVGLPGTIANAIDAGGEWVMRQFGLPTRTEVMRGYGIENTGNPLSGSVFRSGLSAATGGATDYQPQTTAGEYARTVGEFAPAAIAGPGSLLQKSAMATVPALSSETAGQLTEGTALEPWARVGGAVAGGIATAGRVNPAREAAKGAPTREALKGQTDKLYSALRNAGIRYDANAFTSTVQSMTDDLLKSGLRPSVAKEAFAFVDDLGRQLGHSLDFDDLNGLVQTVGEAARGAQRSGNPTLAKAFNIIRDKLDDFERNAPLITNQSLSPNTLNKVRQAARQTALKNIKARAIEEVVKNADTYQSGIEAGIRNGISNLLRSKRGQQLFSGPERTALLQVAQGRKGLRTLSRFGFDLTSIGGNASFLPTIGAIGAGAAGGPVVGAGLAAAGTAAKALSPRLTQRALDQASAAIRSGRLSSPAGIQATQQLRNEMILRRLLAGQMGLQAAGIAASE